MEHIEQIDVTSLLCRPIFQMTGKEVCDLAMYIKTQCLGGEEVSRKTNNYAYGVRALGEAIGCCESQIYALKRRGVLDGAIVSRIGKKIVFNVDKARALACEYKSRDAGRSEILDKNGEPTLFG